MRKRPLLSRLLPPLLAAAFTLAPAAHALAVESPAAVSVQTIQTQYTSTGAQYFGAQLTGDAKLVYDALCQPENLAKSRAAQTITITGFTTVTPSQSAVNAAIKKLSSAAANASVAFDRDFPSVFWMGNMRTTITSQASQSGQVALTLDIRFDTALGWGGSNRSIAEDEATLAAAVSALAAQAPTDSRAAAVTFFHDWLIENNEYNRTAAARGSVGYRDSAPWKAISGIDVSLSPICEGYARAMKLLCNELDIPCLLVSGHSAGEPHMWNYVQLEDGRWYGVDTTFDDPIGGGGSGLLSGNEVDEYLLVGSTTKDTKGVAFSRSHRPRGDDFISFQSLNFTYPTLNETAYDRQSAPVAPVQPSPVPSPEPTQPPATPTPTVDETGWRNPFTDVPTGTWYYAAVRQAVQSGLFTGTSDNTFSPSAPVTRGMLLTVLWRSAGSPQAESASFLDVASDAWYAQAVDWASSTGVTQGVGDGYFGPDTDITREQLAAILYRYAIQNETVTAAGALTGFTDAASVSPWAQDGLCWAVSGGLLTGRGEGILAPGDTASRAEVAIIFQRMTAVDSDQ